MDEPHTKYWIERYGFTVAEGDLLAWVFDGCVTEAGDEFPSWVDYLADSVDDTRASFSKSVADFGADPCDPNAPPDREHQYHDLCEKVLALTEAQARDVVRYFQGFWDGARAGFWDGKRAAEDEEEP